jgi:Zn-dependent protease
MDFHDRILNCIVLILSLTVHEWAHAFSAYRLGDDTAAREGRLTLNPIVHIDPLGTLLLPLLGVPFGWAKPVPVNPTRFARGVNMQRGMMLTSVAGPFSNLVLAFVSMLILVLVARFAPDVYVEQEGLRAFLHIGFGANVALAVFNMLPIPPLDGSRVAEGLMPYRLRDSWESFARIAPFVLLAIIMVPSEYNPVRVPMRYVGYWLQSTVAWMVNLV